MWQVINIFLGVMFLLVMSTSRVVTNMKDDIRKAIIDIVKGSALIIVAGIVFYCVYPKYTFAQIKTDYVKQNVISGKCERIDFTKEDEQRIWDQAEKEYLKEQGIRK